MIFNFLVLFDIWKGKLVVTVEEDSTASTTEYNSKKLFTEGKKGILMYSIASLTVLRVELLAMTLDNSCAPLELHPKQVIYILLNLVLLFKD